jgi:hypothetical protein
VKAAKMNGSERKHDTTSSSVSLSRGQTVPIDENLSVFRLVVRDQAACVWVEALVQPGDNVGGEVAPPAGGRFRGHSVVGGHGEQKVVWKMLTGRWRPAIE